MSQPRSWSEHQARRVGERVKRLRGRRSAQWLADRCAELGHPISRSAIAKLENGRREDIALSELQIVAAALGVPPVLLLFPIGEHLDTEVLPGREVPTWPAAKWFTGEAPLPTRLTDGEVVADPADWQAWQDGVEPLERMRYHDQYLSDWSSAARGAAGARKAAELAKADDEREAHLREATAQDERRVLIEQLISDNRRSMRKVGLDPGELPANLRHLDQDGREEARHE